MIPEINAKPAHILIVDDQEPNRILLADLVSSLGHTPFLADTGLSGIEQLRKQPMDLVLLDIMMPVMDGFEVLERIRTDHALRHMPVIVVSGVDTMDSVLRCTEAGADDYLIKPFNPSMLKARIDACLVKKRLHDAEMEYQRRIEHYNEDLAEQVQIQLAELSAAQRSTIFALSKLAESRDNETGEHLDRMCEYVKVIAEELSKIPKYSHVIDTAYINNIYAAAPLHDVGKVGIPDNILLKPGKLTSEEFEIMKRHTSIGADTLRAVLKEHPRNEFIRLGIEIAESHHERWDGAGYPNGLVGDEIPLAGRILAVADVYDALTSKRCYKEAFTHERSFNIICEGQGSHFDPEIVNAFCRVEQRFLYVRHQLPDTLVV